MFNPRISISLERSFTEKLKGPRIIRKSLVTMYVSIYITILTAHLVIEKPSQY